ncbi:hypothetical protein Lyticum_00539 [Lyticum sinuosum]|uniref:Uncharacterized protein n=1 Tax=Lyticum sinuosum TaxID=1332059 RepID=A0AAE4VM21_9RICK|nr:hypothetical protein [Lyticum sinuosum]
MKTLLKNYIVQKFLLLFLFSCINNIISQKQLSSLFNIVYDNFIFSILNTYNNLEMLLLISLFDRIINLNTVSQNILSYIFVYIIIKFNHYNEKKLIQINNNIIFLIFIFSKSFLAISSCNCKLIYINSNMFIEDIAKIICYTIYNNKKSNKK